MIARRCSQRQFLLRPDRETNNAFTYCLLEAAQRCEVEVLLTCAMSNHHHTVIYDRWGRYPEFVEHFHKMFARSQYVLRGRWENLWSSDQVCVVKLVDRDAVMDKLVYTATNPVADHLVDRVHHWPGHQWPVLAQSWHDQPTSREPRRNLRPRVATRSKWARVEALLRNRAFVEDYVYAREQWRDGASVAFPTGTYWLRRFAYVSVAET